MRRHILSIIVVPTLLFWSATASAAERFCLRLPPDLTQIYDASPRTMSLDYLEDYGRRNGGDWGMPGMRAHIETAAGDDVFGSTSCFGQICLILTAPLDNDGCTTYVNTPGGSSAETFRIRYTQSGAFADGSSYQVWDCGSSNPFYPSCGAATNVIENVAAAAGSNVTHYENLPATVTNILAWEIGFSMKRFPLASTPIAVKYYDATAAAEQGVSTNAWFTSEGTPRINVTGNVYKSKFTFAHEYGHVYSMLRIPSLTTSDFDYCYNTVGPCQHTRTSTEYQAIAAIEGFADFFSAAVWNDGDYNSLAFIPLPDGAYDGELINLESGHSGHEAKYYETNVCNGSCLNGLGVELDWARTFWDFYTNYSPGASVESIALVFDDIHPWPVNGLTDDFYTDFHNGVDNVMGATWETRFVGQAQSNGIDW
jgi:hypothetical protein